MSSRTRSSSARSSRPWLGSSSSFFESSQARFQPYKMLNLNDISALKLLLKGKFVSIGRDLVQKAQMEGIALACLKDQAKANKQQLAKKRP